MNTISGFYFDTINTITAPCDSSLLSSCMEHCLRYERLLSKTLPGSDVWRLNCGDGQMVALEADTCLLLDAALEMYAASGGAFNIAVGALMELWDFKAETPALPDGEKIAQALERCHLEELERIGSSARLPMGMRLDLGGIAKGFIADRIADQLLDEGVTSALLNFGGNIVAIGPKPDGAPWRVGLQTPGGEWGKDYWGVTELTSGTIVTSAVHERGFTLEGVRYHHVLDPRTGYPARSGIVSATVRGQDSMLADALATSILVMGAQAGLALAHRYGCQALAISEEGKVLSTPDFPLIR